MNDKKRAFFKNLFLQVHYSKIWRLDVWLVEAKKGDTQYNAFYLSHSFIAEIENRQNYKCQRIEVWDFSSNYLKLQKVSIGLTYTKNANEIS